MAAFDFIAQEKFRASLELDFAELARCFESEAWKSVHVLAGSIVEALLVDYLVSTPHVGRPKKDPLEMHLSDVIKVCSDEKAISDRAAKLCAAVQSYRNLIHAGRVVRLDEPQPDMDSARVALSLVNIIAGEVGATRTKAQGYTAKMVVAKVIGDPGAAAILKHLLQEVRDSEKRKLLLVEFPEHHLVVTRSGDLNNRAVASRIASAFNLTFEAADAPAKREVVDEFVTKIKEADTDHVDWYRRAFFTKAFVPLLSGASRVLVKDYLFGMLRRSLKDACGVFIDKGELLDVEDANEFVDPFVRTLATQRFPPPVHKDIITQFGFTNWTTSESFQVAAAARLDYFSMLYHTSEERLVMIAELKESMDIPF